MRPIVQTLSDASGGALYSNPIPLDHFVSPFNTSLSVQVTGTVDYTVQYTFDDVQAATYTPASGNWIAHPNLTAKLTTLDSNLAYPATAVRVVLNSGGGSIRFTVIQAGI
jgi:hypothetical protein